LSVHLDIDLIAEALERSRDALRKYLRLVRKILGSSPDEIQGTLKAMEGLTPAQIREACEVYKGLHPEEVAALTVRHREGF